MRNSRQLVLACLALLCAPACQQTSTPNAAAVTVRPIKPRDVVFKRGYYSRDQVDQLPRPQGEKFAHPRYPSDLRKSGVSGEIKLVVAIDERGNVAEIQAASATDERFVESAKETIRNWQFTPAMKDGKPVAVWLPMPIKFVYH